MNFTFQNYKRIHSFCFFEIAILFWMVLLLVMPAILSANPVQPQHRFQNQIYESFVSGNIPLWERTIAEMEQHFGPNPSSGQLYDLLLARYGFIALSLDDNASLARTHLNKAEDELERFSRFPRYAAHAHAFRAAFLGFRISLRPLAAIRLGPRSYAAVDAAIEADPTNPLGWMEKGNTRFYTPSTFGGSKQDARDAYSRAISLFENNMLPQHRWLYLNSLVGLAKSYQYTDNIPMAIATYKKALTFEPEFKWVRDDLLPELLSNQ